MRPLTEVSEITVNYHPAPNWNMQPRITSSEEAEKIIRSFFPKETIHMQESFLVIYLNNYSRVKGIYLMAKGGMSSTIVDVRLILATALKVLATGIIIAHNHPSNNSKPSNSDIDLTRKISKAAGLMDITLMDHLIILPEEGKYFSFADNGIICMEQSANTYNEN